MTSVIDAFHPVADGVESSSAAERDRVEIRLTGVSKAYGAVRALDDITVTFRGGEVHALCGHNGAGKSTLMKVLTGIVQPDAGEIEIDGEPVRFRGAADAQRAGLAIVDQELALVPSLSVGENLVLGNLDESFVRRPRRARAKARELLARVKLERIDPATPLARLEPGERKLVEIAHALGRNARFVILDEPTASLSQSEADMLYGAIRQLVAEGAGVAFVSHRLGEVLELSQHITVLRDGRVVGSGPVEAFDRGRVVDLMLGEEGRELPAPVAGAQDRSGGDNRGARGLAKRPRV